MKKGFTLVELLAVVVLLAIVALIATPIIGNVIETSEESANQRSIEGYADAIRNEYYNQQTGGGIPVIDDAFLANIDTEGNEISCENVLYSTEYQVILNKCTIADEIDKQYCYASGNHYDCEDSEFLSILQESTISDSSDPISFAEDSWETIANAVKNNNTSKYNVGDTKEVTLTGDYAGTYTVRIANNSTPTECSTEGFSQTACGFVVEFVDIITEHEINSTVTNLGGWPASEMYNFVNTNIYNALPSDLQNVIINTYTVSGHGSNDSTNFTSTDKLYLLSAKEIWGSVTYDSVIDETRQLDYYEDNGATESNYSNVSKNYQEVENTWWTRTSYSYNNEDFYNAYTDGGVDFSHAYNNNIGVAPAFRIG